MKDYFKEYFKSFLKTFLNVLCGTVVISMIFVGVIGIVASFVSFSSPNVFLAISSFLLSVVNLSLLIHQVNRVKF